MGLALPRNRDHFVSLPSGQSLGEAEVGILEAGPLHNNLEKRWSEPSWLEQVEHDIDSEFLPCQEDSIVNA
jgi:hypothetical protein